MSNTPVDSLKVGDWIAVTDAKFAENEHINFTGRPYCIRAVSLPFVALVDTDGDVTALDVCDWAMRKVSRAYVNAMRKAATASVPEQGQAHPRCIRCGSRLVQRLCAERKWHAVCPQCGADFGEVQS